MRNKFVFLVSIALLLHTVALAQSSKAKLIGDFVAAKQKYHHFNGNILVTENGKVIYKRSVGFSDLKTRKSLTDRSIFEIASVTKQFTAAAIMLCRERGLLNLNDSLSKYFPDLPFPGVTIRQMLTHTSGLPEQNELMYKV